MQGVGDSSIDFVLHCANMGYQFLTRACRPATSDSRVNRLFMFTFGIGLAAVGAAVWAANFSAPSFDNCENGDLWNGRCYPYNQFPHGHLDAVPDSTIFDQNRFQKNYDTRANLFLSAGICTRGHGVVYGLNYYTDSGRIEDPGIACLPDGTLLNVQNFGEIVKKYSK